MGEEAFIDIQKTSKSLQDEIDDMSAKINTLETQHREETEKNKSLHEEKISIVQKQVKALQKDLDSAKKDLAIKISQFEQEKSELLRDNEADVNKLNKSVESKLSKIDELEAKLKT